MVVLASPVFNGCHKRLPITTLWEHQGFHIIITFLACLCMTTHMTIHMEHSIGICVDCVSALVWFQSCWVGKGIVMCKQQATQFT